MFRLYFIAQIAIVYYLFSTKRNGMMRIIPLSNLKQPFNFIPTIVQFDMKDLDYTQAQRARTT